MTDSWDRSGPPPTGDDLRAVVADAGVTAAELPVTAELMKKLAQFADEQTGDRARDDARTLSAIIEAIVSLELRIVDGVR